VRIGRWLAVFVAVMIQFAGTPSASAAWDPEWHRAPAMSIQAVAADRAGHVYVTGFAPRGPERYFGRPLAMVLAKFDAAGNRLWTRTWRGTARFWPFALGMSLAVAPDGGLVYAGGALISDAGENARARLWAYSAAGRLRWIARWPHTHDAGIVSAVATRPSGVVAGGFSVGAWDRDGSRRWVRPFSQPFRNGFGVVRDIGIEQGHVLAAGFVGRLDPEVTEVLYPGPLDPRMYEDTDAAIRVYTASGTLVWSLVREDPTVRDHDAALSLDVSADRILVAGQIGTSQSRYRGWLARLSSGGRIVSAERYGDPDGLTRVAGVSRAPWDHVYLVLDRRSGRADARRTLVLREQGLWGAHLSKRSITLRPHATASGVATTWGRKLYVTAQLFAEGGDLWRLPP